MGGATSTSNTNSNQNTSFNNTSTTSNSSQTNPWSVQEGYLKQIFGQAQSAYDKANANAANAPTNFVAQFDPSLIGVYNKMIGYANDPTAANAATNAGINLSNTGTTGVQGALSGLSNFQPQGNASSIAADAATLASNPYTSGMVTAAMRDATRAANEAVLPQISRNAALSGNTDSTRTAIQQGIVQRGLAEKAADVSANLQGSAYNQGIQTAAGLNTTNNAQRLQALQSQGSIGNSAAATGAGSLTSGNNILQSLMNMGMVGGQGLTSGAQANLDNQLQAYNFGQTSPWTALNNYYGIVGANNWGSSSTETGSTNTSGTSNTVGSSSTTEKNNPGFWSIMGGLLGAGGQLAKGFK